MKHEPCSFESCRFSRVCNHIHCIRTGCEYVLHSSGQLYSHKRKHERRDNELAYRKFKMAHSMMRQMGDGVPNPSLMQNLHDQVGLLVFTTLLDLWISQIWNILIFINLLQQTKIESFLKFRWKKKINMVRKIHRNHLKWIFWLVFLEITVLKVTF